MFSKEEIKCYKKSIIKNEDKIILCIGFVLVAILSYGAGKLSVAYRPATPIIFKDSANCQKALTGEEIAAVESAKNEGKIIGNKKSLIYHLPGGAFYDKVSLENRVYFNSEAEAQKAGYRKAKN